jgi:hypothetical protein
MGRVQEHAVTLRRTGNICGLGSRECGQTVAAIRFS